MEKKSNISEKKKSKEKKGNLTPKSKGQKEKKFLFKENFNKALEKSGYNNKTLAEDINISVPTISKWISEKNPQPITENNLIRIARQLNVSKDYLLGKSEDSTPEMIRVYEKVSEINKAKRDFIKFLGFNKSVYRERNGKYYCMFLNEKENNWKYCDVDYLNFLEDQIIDFGYNLLYNYFNSDMVNEFDKKTTEEIKEEKIKLHRELWGYDMFKGTHAIMTKDSEEFKENYEILEEHPEFEFEDMKEDENGNIIVKTKGSNEYRPIEEVPSALTIKAKKKKPTEEEIVNQKRYKRLAEKYNQEEAKKKDK